MLIYLLLIEILITYRMNELFRNPHKGNNKSCRENNVVQNSESLILSAISSGNLRSPLLLVDRLSAVLLGIPFVRITFARSGLNFADKN